MFCAAHAQEMDGILADSNMFTHTMVEKGKGHLGKGSHAKGFGKGAGKGNPKVPKEDGPAAPKSEAEQLAEAYSKAKKMRDLSTIMMSKMQDCLQVAKKSKYWSKSAQKDADALIGKLETSTSALKKVLMKGSCTVDELKAMVLDTAEVVKECQMSCKEYKQVANKTGSLVSKGSKKK